MAPKSSKAKGASLGTKPTPHIDPKSSFTPENFERELKELAAKAKENTWEKQVTEQASAYLKSAVLLILIATYSNVSQLALSPVYGSIPSSIWHSKVVMAACFVGWSSNYFLNRTLPFKPQMLLPVIAIYIPTMQFYLYKLSGILAASWGPLVTEALTLFPLMVVSVGCVATLLEDADFSLLPKWLGDAAPGLGSYGIFKITEVISANLIPRYMGTSVVYTRLGLEMVLAASYTLFAPSKLVLYALPALLHTAFLNTHMPTSAALLATNRELMASENYAVLDRRESLTGYVSVIENVGAGFRAMRCDHSLLGGEWIRFNGMDQFKDNQVAEPIYGVFTMLEAVRLVKVPKPVTDNRASALVIGLGIGTTPAALITHGINTTVVEIDPVVHEFALKYFRLPRNHTAVIEDAVGYAARLVKENTTRFDYIVHDVFTGGAEPVDLFTLEFLQSLHALLNPNGVIAINYAGDFKLPPPKVVVETIKAVFPSCRAFREIARNEEEVEREGRDFTNMVLFCTKVAPAGTQTRVSFRAPTERDFLNSPSRRKFLVPEHEVTDDHFLAGHRDDGVVRRNDTLKLVKWHETSARGHWTVMRTVLPQKVWEAW